MALREHGRDSIGRFDFDGGEVEAEAQELLDPNSNVVLQNGNKKPYGFGLAHCSLPNELGQPALEIAERLLIGADNFSCTSGMPFNDESSVIYFGGAGRLRDGVYLYFLGHSAQVSSIAKILTFLIITLLFAGNACKFQGNDCVSNYPRRVQEAAIKRQTEVERCRWEKPDLESYPRVLDVILLSRPQHLSAQKFRPTATIIVANCHKSN